MYSVWRLKLVFLRLCKHDPVRNDSIPLGRGANLCHSSVLAPPPCIPTLLLFQGYLRAAALSQPIPGAVAGISRRAHLPSCSTVEIPDLKLFWGEDQHILHESSSASQFLAHLIWSSFTFAQVLLLLLSLCLSEHFRRGEICGMDSWWNMFLWACQSHSEGILLVC